jgi:hypothetical protein
MLTSDAGVGHVRVHTTTAVPSRTSTCAASDGLVVSHARITKREVVHATLGMSSEHTIISKYNYQSCRVMAP